MRHPTEGVLRRLSDEPSGVADADRRHVAGCPQCLGRLASRIEDAVPDAAATLPRAGRSRRLLRCPAVAALAVAVVLTGAGTAAANDWLQIFKTNQIAPVSVGTSDLVALPDLSAYGEVVVTGDVDVRPVPDAAAASAQTGLDVPEVTALPRGVSGEPVQQVGVGVKATFTFSADRAARAAAEAGRTLPIPPPGLDGSQLRLAAGPGVASIWSQPAGVPTLFVALLTTMWVTQRPSPVFVRAAA